MNLNKKIEKNMSNLIKRPVMFILMLLVAFTGFMAVKGSFDSQLSVASISSAQSLLEDYSFHVGNLPEQEKIELREDIDNEIEELTEDINEFEYMHQDKMNQYNTLNSELSSLRARLNSSSVASLNKGIRNSRSRINHLQNRYSRLKSRCRGLRSKQRSRCNGRARDVRALISNERRAIVGLRAQIRSANVDNIALNLEINLLTISANSAKAEADEFLDKKNTAQDLIRDLKDKKAETYEYGGGVVGCTDPAALDYDPQATVDNGSCSYPTDGCTDVTASNWDSSATTDDGSCEYTVKGCIDKYAINFDPQATENDGSCEYEVLDDCICGEESGGTEPESENDLEETQTVTVNITKFGGPDDLVMGSDETLAVFDGLGRDLNPEDIYTAWPMTKGEKELGLPHSVECLAPGEEVGSAAGNEEVNKAFKDKYDAEISYTDSNGNTKTVTSPIADRGPGDPGRWDASVGLWKALGLDHLLDGDPNNPDERVDLEVRLVPKAGSCPGSGS